VILDDGQFRHFLYDTEPLSQIAIKTVHENLSGLAMSLTPLIGLSATPSCDWSTLSDEDFEQLCYDVIFAHPKLTRIQSGNLENRDRVMAAATWKFVRYHLTAEGPPKSGSSSASL
jgi:hypothetical protein